MKLLEKGLTISNILSYRTWYFVDESALEMAGGLGFWNGSNSMYKCSKNGAIIDEGKNDNVEIRNVQDMYFMDSNMRYDVLAILYESSMYCSSTNAM